MGNQCVAKQLPPIFLLWFLYPLLQEGSSSGCPVPSVAAADPGPCMTLSSSCCSPELHSMAQRGTAHWTQLGTILFPAHGHWDVPSAVGTPGVSRH